MIKIDMWYGDAPGAADKVSVFFSDIDSVYWGNFYKNGKAIGDYVATDSDELDRFMRRMPK